MSERKIRGGNRQREKESHLQGVFDLPEVKKTDDKKTIRANIDAYELIDSIYHTKRLKSRAEALDEIIKVYKQHTENRFTE